MHINPDFYLHTPQGRIFSEELNQQAWKKCYQMLDSYLASGWVQKIYLLVGAQGSGKTTWVYTHCTTLPNSLFFDAILVKKSERKVIIDRARKFGIPCVAVYFHITLEKCLIQNRQRPPDEIVSEQALKNVYQAIEQPILDEGLESIIHI